MQAPVLPAASRLARLDRYLQEDPANAQLLADAFETALAGGQHDRALEYIASADRHALDPAQWTFRRARLCIAGRQLGQAAELLEQLRASAGDQPVLAHDLGYVRLLQGDPAGCRDVLRPWLRAPGAADAAARGDGIDGALQVLWLRATHRLGELEEAWGFARELEAAGRLQPAARGVASLVAVDRGDFQAARAWSGRALAEGGDQPEALVASATVALALGDPHAAGGLLQRALARHPEDGRTWSALGFASLQARDLPTAQGHLERAVRLLPEHVGTWHALGWARLLQGDCAAALQAFQQALSLDRNFAETHGALGLVLALQGEQAQARRHLELADRLDRDNVTGRYARALLAGDATSAAQLDALARHLLDRPGFFGGSLSDALPRDPAAAP